MSNVWSFWLHIYFCALESACENRPTLYSSRIDGAVLPYYRRNAQETIVVEIDCVQIEQNVITTVINNAVYEEY